MMKGRRMAKRPSLGSIMRKRLSDITNTSHPQSNSPIHLDILSPSPSSSAKHYTDSLVKLQKLRACLQKMQLQNLSLAQSNSRMQAELNIGKDKLKTLQHELVCKDALLKAKNLELEVQRKVHAQNNGSRHGDETDMKCKVTKDNKARKGSRRRRPLRSRSMGPLTTSPHGTEKDMGESKRRCLRKQSPRFKWCDQEPKENLFELEDKQFRFYATRKS